MREIKFRAWEKKNCLMIRFGEGTRYSVHFDGTIEEFRPALGNKYPAHFINKTSDFILMEFIGLKDKNRREIYEGDICKDGDMMFEIVWFHDSCAFKAKYFDGKISLWNIEKLFAKRFEVIGNIYENSELLDNND